MKKLSYFTLLISSIIGFNLYGQNSVISNNKSPFEVQIINMNCMEVPVSKNSIVQSYEAKKARHNIGFATQNGWAVKNANTLDDGGYLLKGIFLDKIVEGGLRVLFKIKVDKNDMSVWDKLIRLEIFDSTLNSIICQQDIERNYFRTRNEFQNFVLHADLKNRKDHTIEARIWYYGKAEIEVEKVTFIIDPFKEGAPFIINQSTADLYRIKQLLAKAISGLGFKKINYDGPNENDIIYVNNYYMVWVDQTGYYGKANAVWLMNNLKGNSLDFLENTLYEGRVVNFLGVGEDGNGEWLESYMGAEHYEIPSFIRENDDSNEAISGWYTVNEANPNLGTGGNRTIPWWVCCSGITNGKQSFSQMNPPLQFSLNDSSLLIKYLNPITKGVDGDGLYDGDRCYANVLFHNNIRYPLYLELGYIFYKDKPYFDRTYQLINTKGNVTLPSNTFMALIQGLIITKTSHTIPWKVSLFNYVKPQGKKMVFNNWEVENNNWAKLYIPDAKFDILGSIQAPNTSFIISSDKSFNPGRSFYHTLYYKDSLPSKNGKADVALCQCVAHGGWEIGSVMITNNSSIPAGTGSEQVIRRFGFPQGELIKE